MTELGILPENCEHLKCLPPNGFDEQAAKSLTYQDIRKRWPRFFGQCPDCKQNVIIYSSLSHYLYGDW